MEAPGHRQHSGACRRRLYELMMKDPDEVDRLNWNEARMGREATRAEEIPRSPELQLKRSAKVENGRKTKDRRGLAAPMQPSRMQQYRKQLRWNPNGRKPSRTHPKQMKSKLDKSRSSLKPTRMRTS